MLTKAYVKGEVYKAGKRQIDLAKALKIQPQRLSAILGKHVARPKDFDHKIEEVLKKWKKM